MAPKQDVVTQFKAMASPCVVLADTADPAIGERVGEVVRQEAMRIEAKFSRYRPSVITTINESAGSRVELDAETSDLIDYAATCHDLSDGCFDITSGVLRRVWRFDGRGVTPDPDEVARLLRIVGWHRVSWKRPWLQLAPGMEIDFGGIGKEYAVDQALSLGLTVADVPLLVNFGGDLRVSGPRRDGTGWIVSIEDVDQVGNSAGLLQFTNGALATSGDTYRRVIGEGVRYSHVLDSKTGWPVQQAPRSVTVHAATCSEAGLLAKLALLRGADAEDFLRQEEVRSWCIR